MTAQARVRVTCDGPGCEVYVEGPYGDEPSKVRAVLASQGWTIAPEYHYEPDFCPAHAPKEPR